jgi:hypothetical protein
LKRGDRCGPCYVDEVRAFTAAVNSSTRALTLSYSPGGGNSVVDGAWVAGQRAEPTAHAAGGGDGALGSMYRIVTDFHGGWYGWGGLQQSLFIQGNVSTQRLEPHGTHHYPPRDPTSVSTQFEPSNS